MAYRIKEVFATIQGEGIKAGTPAVFVRFAGCNLWGGENATRKRDAARNRAACPMWCDTDFRKGTSMEWTGVLSEILAEAGTVKMSSIPLIVLTGGEPMLQVDDELMAGLRSGLGRKTKIAIETNGTIQIPRSLDRELDWVCVSPKQLPSEVRHRCGNELKIPYPGSLVEPEEYANKLVMFDNYVLTPRAELIPGKQPGHTRVRRTHAEQVAEYCMAHPRWRMSLQMHKHAGLP